MKEKNVLIIDGQGGRLGGLLTERVRARLPQLYVTAVGVNAIATGVMLKAGAQAGATGEYPVICAAQRADYILGPVGIGVPASLTGEITPAIAEAVGRSRAEKILIPGQRCALHIVGASHLTLTEYAERAVDMLEELLREEM